MNGDLSEPQSKPTFRLEASMIEYCLKAVYSYGIESSFVVDGTDQQWRLTVGCGDGDDLPDHRLGGCHPLLLAGRVMATRAACQQSAVSRIITGLWEKTTRIFCISYIPVRWVLVPAPIPLDSQ